MIGLLLAVFLFNFLAVTLNKHLNGNCVLHIWMFTISFQMLFDIFIDFKYAGYWYFSKDIDWQSILNIVFLVPPVNIIFLNYFPFKQAIFKQFCYIICWDIALLLYEKIALLSEPWGYFHYGWWKLSYSALLNPILLFLLVLYFKYICYLEKRLT
ncbi:MAG: hypothetical protein ABF649_04500 [Bacillus sp. (in: firmicutes)]